MLAFWRVQTSNQIIPFTSLNSLSATHVPLNPIGSHRTPTSLAWLQLLGLPMGRPRGHSMSLSSLELQFRLSSKILPVPAVNGSLVERR